LDRIEIEMAGHGGTDNGKLPVTYDDFERYGIHRHAIGPAISETVALGFLEITEPGRAGNAEWRKPNLFRLTYRQTKYEPTNEWEKIKTIEEAQAVAQAARATPRRPKKNESQWRKAPVFGGGKRHHMDKIQGTETSTTSDGAEIATTLDISGREPSSAERPSGGAPNGDASARSEGRRRQKKRSRERSEPVSGPACSDGGVSSEKPARSHDGRLAEVRTLRPTDDLPERWLKLRQISKSRTGGRREDRDIAADF
jgi:hypothetical protein